MEAYMCDDFFDDFGWEELAIAMGLGEEIAGEERERRRLHQDDEAFVSEDDDPTWYEDE
jgi:hypothetical protein